MLSGFRQSLLRGDTLIGTLLSLPSPEIAEIVAGLGFDWLFLDTEHGAHDAQACRAQLQAMAGRCAAVVRVPGHDDVWIKKALDIGADGIIAPQVSSAAQAAGIVASCKYPPQGRRGLGPVRANAYGYAVGDYFSSANENLAVIVQAETAAAVDNIDAIVAVEGVDAVLIGPSDLSASLGCMGRLDDPLVESAIGTIKAACDRQGLRLGMFGMHADAMRNWIDTGFTLIAAGTDVAYLRDGACNMLESLRPD